METILGKWQQPKDQPFAGLWFKFNADGTFVAFYPEMSIESSGFYTAADGLIDLDQTKHSFGLTGKFTGRYLVEGSNMIMNLADPGATRPESLEGKNRRVYERMAE